MHFSKIQRRLAISLVVLVLLSLTASRPTLVTAQSGGCSAGLSFKVAREYAVGRLPTLLASGDLNQDGVPDLVVGNSGTLRFSILLGNGQGELATLTEYPVDSFIRDLLLGDFNNDGKLDVVVSGVSISQPGPPVTFATGIALALGNGDGTFGELKPYAVGTDVAMLASSDFNRDGKLDLAVTDRSQGNLVILSGKGDGSFNAPVTYKTGAGTLPLPTSVVAADFNQDGKPDIVVANQNERSLSVFLNNGSGGFGTPNNISVRECPNLFVGDFSGDGQPDLLIGSSVLMITLRGDGAGGFTTPSERFLSDVAINTAAHTVTSGDFNGDGKPDIAFASTLGITLMLNDGKGDYTTRNYGAGRQPSAIVAADFDRDGKPDIAATNQESGTVTVLLNAGAADFRGMKAAKISFSLQWLSVADLNNDGKPDLLTHDGAGVYYGLGNGTGEFTDTKLYDAATKVYRNVTASVVADFTGDGNLDIAAISGSQNDSLSSVVTLLPDVILPAPNAASYANRVKTFPVGTRATDLVTADFNGDRRPDLAVAVAGTDEVVVLLNDGRGGFVKSATLGVGLDPGSLVTGDFNSDGKADVVVACRNSAGIFLLLGDGQGGFAVNAIGIGANPRVVVTGDFNRDGKLDLAVAHNNSMFVSILLGTGQGSFTVPMTIDVGGRPYALTVGDFNGDNNPDLAVTRYIQSFSDTIFEDRVLLFAGDGAGKFARAGELSVPGATQLRAADFNNDGLMDLAVAASPTSGGQAVWIAFNSCNAPLAANAAVTVNAASYAGAAAAPEAIVSAFGTGLSNGTFNAPGVPLPTKLGETQITLKDSKGVERTAPIFFVSPFQVNYQIPAGTAAGIATVTIRNGTEKTSTSTVLILPSAPGLFAANANGEGVAAAQVFRIKFPSNAESYEEIAQFDAVQKKFVPRPIDTGTGFFPAQDKIYLLLFGTGLRSRLSADAVRVKIGNAELSAEYAGPQPQYVGLDQVNVLISGLRAVGEVDVTVIVDGKASNTVRVNIQ